MALNVTGNFDGGNPQEKDAISRISGNLFLVKPFCEDSQTGYKFRLDIEIENEDEETRFAELIVEWGDTRYSCCRDTFYLKGTKAEWRPVKGITQGSLTRLSCPVSPGRSQLALNPTYNYKQYLEFINTLPSREGFSRRLLHTTELGREVYVLTAIPSGKTSKRILISARTHPYESAGSYNIEGLMEGISKLKGDWRLAGCDFWIVPMVCPDGVADGLCRLNRAGGPDLSREIDINDDLCRAYMALIDEIKPSLFIEFHSWMLKDRDGVFYLSAWDSAITILRMRMRTPPHVRKRWIRGLDNLIIKRKPLGLKQYAEERFGAKCVVVEFPWFNRSVKDMKMLGLQTLLSILPIV